MNLSALTCFMLRICPICDRVDRFRLGILWTVGVRFAYNRVRRPVQYQQVTNAREPHTIPRGRSKCLGSRVRVISGVGFDDHTVSAFELHVWPVADPWDESACSVLRERIASASAGEKGDDLFRDAGWARPDSLRGVGSNVSVSQSGRVTVEPAARVAQAPPHPSSRAAALVRFSTARVFDACAPRCCLRCSMRRSARVRGGPLCGVSASRGRGGVSTCMRADAVAESAAVIGGAGRAGGASRGVDARAQAPSHRRTLCQQVRHFRSTHQTDLLTGTSAHTRKRRHFRSTHQKAPAKGNTRPIIRNPIGHK